MVAKSSEFVRDSETLRRDDTSVAAGLPVLPGFVVSGQAYLHALDAAGCRQRLLDPDAVPRTRQVIASAERRMLIDAVRHGEQH